MKKRLTAVKTTIAERKNHFKECGVTKLFGTPVHFGNMTTNYGFISDVFVNALDEKEYVIEMNDGACYNVASSEIRGLIRNFNKNFDSDWNPKPSFIREIKAYRDEISRQSLEVQHIYPSMSDTCSVNLQQSVKIAFSL